MNARGRKDIRSAATDSVRGMALLRDPLLNKGTAFAEQERDQLSLRCLLPAHVQSMDAQAATRLNRNLPARRAGIRGLLA